MITNIYELTAEFRKSVTPEVVRQFRILWLAISMGVMSFGLIIVFLETAAYKGAAVDVDAVFNLSIAHGVAACILFPLSAIIRDLILRKNNPEKTGRPVDSTAAIALIRTAFIIRAALMEAAAMFGLVVCFMAVTGGATTINFLYWLNSLSAVCMLIYMCREIPSQERIVSAYTQKIHGADRK